MHHYTLTSRAVAALPVLSLVIMTGCGAGGGAHDGSPSATAAASSTTTATQSARGTVYAIPGCYPPVGTTAGQDRPTGVVLQGCMSNGLWLEGMSWTSWGPDGADGTGTVAANTCAESCASGPVVKNPVVVHAQNPQAARQGSQCPADVLFYSDVVLAFPKGLPPTQYVAVGTRFREMPASEITAQSAPASPNDWGYPQCS